LIPVVGIVNVGADLFFESRGHNIMVRRATTMSERHANVGVDVGARKVPLSKTSGWTDSDRGEEWRKIFSCDTDGGAWTDLSDTETRGEKAVLETASVKTRMPVERSFMVERCWNCSNPGTVELSCRN
jgi:hypothetical protein